MDGNEEIKIDDRIYYPDIGVIEEKFQNFDDEDIMLGQDYGGCIWWKPGNFDSGKYIVEII